MDDVLNVRFALIVIFHSYSLLISGIVLGVAFTIIAIKEDIRCFLIWFIGSLRWDRLLRFALVDDSMILDVLLVVFNLLIFFQRTIVLDLFFLHFFIFVFPTFLAIVLFKFTFQFHKI